MRWSLALVMAILCISQNAMGQAPVAAAVQDLPSVMSEGIYCRETQDQDWHVQLTGEVVSLAGIYVVVQSVEGKLIFQAKVPTGQYPADSPFTIHVPRDGQTGDYLVTILGTQADHRGLRLPYTSLPGEVYGGKVFAIMPARPRSADEAAAPGELVFQVTADQPEITITQSQHTWTLHGADGQVVFDVQKHGQKSIRPNNLRTDWTGVFKGEPGKTYLLGQNVRWFLTNTTMYLSTSADRWFEPDARFRTFKWWMEMP